jgi:hypothetical protein
MTKAIKVRFTRETGTFLEWVMLASNQRPLPCEVSTIVL